MVKTLLVGYLDVIESPADDGSPQSASNDLPELGLVDELNFLVSNSQSRIIAQVGLWSS